MKKTGVYRAWGPVRGACKHRHFTAEGAWLCVQRDMTGCRGQGGYSDRFVQQLVDGSWVKGDREDGEE